MSGPATRPEVCSMSREENFDLVRGNQTLRSEDTPVETIMSSPDIISGLGTEDEDLLFLSDLMPNNSSQDHDASNFDFSYSKIVENTDGCMTLQKSHATSRVN